MNEAAHAQRPEYRILLIAAAALLTACGDFSESESLRLTPTPDVLSASGVYAPKNLEDALIELHKMLPPKFIAKVKAQPEAKMIQYHENLGMWLRNNWGLWKDDSPLSRYFNERGIHHADDMSGIIFDSFWRRLQGQPLELEEQVKVYQEYWRHWDSPAERLPVPPPSDSLEAVIGRLTPWTSPPPKLSPPK